MKLAEKLVHLRKEKGLSQYDVASALNVSRQAISRWESDSSAPSTDNLKYLNNQFRYQSLAFLITFGIMLLTGCSRLSDSRIDGLITKYDPSLALTTYIYEESNLTCEYEFQAPEEATYLQINVEQYSNGKTNRLLAGGASIGEERLPVDKLSGTICINTTNNHLLSLVIALAGAGTVNYEVPIDTFDNNRRIDVTVMATPIVPTVDKTICLLELKSQESDNFTFLTIEIKFGA